MLIHGLGAVGRVWDGLQAELARRWPGRWVTPDLPGHGRSAPLDRYTFGGMAAAVASAVPDSDRVVVLGHSLGGVVALELASGRHGLRPRAVAGLGIKVAWTEEELARAGALAARANPVYPTRQAAAERYLKVAGLVGLVGPEDVADEAVTRLGEGWAPAFDPKVFAVGAPDLPALLSAAACPVILGAGEHDPMCRVEQIAELVPDPVTLPGLGHNAHVESPLALWPLIDRLRAAA